MKVSIVIPSYGQAAYLSQAIESALHQTMQCEIIVVDDGSTDGSLAIAKSYEPQIKVIAQINKGLASARNTGIMNATGDYILPLDADDILMPDCVERLLAEAKRSGADVVAPSMRNFGTSTGDTILLPNPTIQDFKMGNRIPYCALIKKEALLECGGYSPRMTYGYEDYHLWFDLLTRGKKIVSVPEVLMQYRTKENSMLQDALKHHEELMDQIAKDFPQIYA